MRQKDAVLMPLVQGATECVHRVSADPRYKAELRPDEINADRRLNLGLQAAAACDDRRP